VSCCGAALCGDPCTCGTGRRSQRRKQRVAEYGAASVLAEFWGKYGAVRRAVACGVYQHFAVTRGAAHDSRCALLLVLDFGKAFVHARAATLGMARVACLGDRARPHPTVYRKRFEITMSVCALAGAPPARVLCALSATNRQTSAGAPFWGDPSLCAACCLFVRESASSSARWHRSACIRAFVPRRR